MLSDDNKTLIATDSQELFHYEASTGKLMKSEPLAPGGGGYYYARLTAESRRGVFVKAHASLDVISLNEPTKPANIAVRPAPSSHSFAISANGKRVAVADQTNKQVVVWDSDKNQIIDQWPIDTIAAQTVALSQSSAALGNDRMTSAFVAFPSSCGKSGNLGHSRPCRDVRSPAKRGNSCDGCLRWCLARCWEQRRCSWRLSFM
jgi:hypothetical protein